MPHNGGVRNSLGTPNEARGLEDLPPSKLKGADGLWLQGAMAPIERLAEAPAPRPSSGPGAAPGAEEQPAGPKPPAPPGAPAPAKEPEERGEARLQWQAQREAVLVSLQDAIDRARRRESSAFERASKRTKGDPHAFEEWLAPFVQRSREVLVEMLEPGVTTFERLALAAEREAQSPVAGALATFADEWAREAEVGMRQAWGRRAAWGGHIRNDLEGLALLERLEATLVPMEV